MQDGPQVIVPKFNSAVLFAVPREHWVTEMSSDAPLRYTVFGWFHDARCPPPGPPLGSGNQQLLANGTADTERRNIAGWLAASPYSAPAIAAAEKTHKARSRCEQAFEKVFGIQPEQLALGTSNSKAGVLVRQLL